MEIEDKTVGADTDSDYDLMMENAERLSDLAMAVSGFDDDFAKRSLAIALGILCGLYPETCMAGLHELTQRQAASYAVAAVPESSDN